MPYQPHHTSPEQSAVLDAVLDRAAGDGRRGVAVLDLDGTLFDTRPRQAAILAAYAEHSGAVEFAQVRAEHFHDWSLAHTLEHAAIPPALARAHLPRLEPFWSERFFDGEWLRHDVAMPGAPEFVRALDDCGVSIVYLTGRHTAMRAGTVGAIKRVGLPWGAGRHLLLKPNQRGDDTAFKDRALERIARLGRPTIFLDNEPSNVNLFARRHPEACVVFVETDHSFRPVKPAPGLPRIRGFLR